MDLSPNALYALSLVKEDVKGEPPQTHIRKVSELIRLGDLTKEMFTCKEFNCFVFWLWYKSIQTDAEHNDEEWAILRERLPPAA